MKLKLKATLQDWVIFGLFSLLLLYIVCIAVQNISNFAAGDLEQGFILNPFPAFTPRYLAATILLFVGGLIFLFVSVSSHFFDRDSGFGIKIGSKESKGFSRWSTDKEMKKTLSEVVIRDNSYQAAGFPIVNNGSSMWVDDGESHNLVIGSTGTGKTQCIIHPLVKILAKKGESMIVTDPKGEIYRESASLLKEKGYKIVVLNFRDPQQGNCWNPLSLPYNLYRNGNTDKAMELLDDLAANILYEENSKDPFWSQTASDYFAGIALGLFDDAKPEEININSISLTASLGDEKSTPRSTYMKDYFNMKDPASAAYTCASGTVYAPEDTKGSIVSTFKQKIRLFSSRENLSEMLSNSDFDMASIGKEKTAVFMIIQDEKKTYHALATIFIKQCYETLIDVAQRSEKGELPVRTNFILDEFANMPPLKDITTMITAARSRLIRFTMIIQNFAQLDSVYGKENAQTIRSNCNNLLYLLTTELAALKEISELCGEIKVKVGKGDKEREETRPLITVSDLQKMKQFEAIVIRTRLNPFKTRLKPNFEIDWGISKKEADPFVQREKQPIHVFNLKEFMNKKNEEKRLQMMKDPASAMNNNPFGGMGMFGNPGMFPGPSPMPNSNPFGRMGGMATENPFATQKTESNNFNMDDLVKRIDAKIAEIEREEQEKENKEKALLENIDKKELSESIDKKDNINTSVVIPKDTSNQSKTKITEDQFFDDFFDE